MSVSGRIMKAIYHFSHSSSHKKNQPYIRCESCSDMKVTITAGKCFNASICHMFLRLRLTSSPGDKVSHTGQLSEGLILQRT